MKKLKESKLLQSFIGFGSVVIVLWSGTLLVNKISAFDETLGVLWWEAAAAIAVTVLLCGFIIGLSAFAKRYKMSWLYYPVFIVSFVSALATYISYYIESSVTFLFWGLFLVPLRTPFTDITEGLENLLEYPVDYGGKASYMYYDEFTILFLAVIILSLVIYQHPTKKEKRICGKWLLDPSTECMAKIMIGAFGGYVFLADICLALPYDNILYTVLASILCPVALLFAITLVVYILPLSLCIILIIKSVTQAKEEKNVRLAFHPYVVTAVVATLVSVKRILDIALLCF